MYFQNSSINFLKNCNLILLELQKKLLMKTLKFPICSINFETILWFLGAAAPQAACRNAVRSDFLTLRTEINRWMYPPNILQLFDFHSFN